MSPAVLTLIVLAFVAILFITEAIPLAITAMGGAVAVGLLKIIPMNAVFSGLSNSTIILFGGMFVIGAAMFHTGLAQYLGERVVRAVGGSENGLMFGVMFIGAFLSAFTSNTGTTACLMPVVLGICAAAEIPASRQLMPLAYAAGLGGVITMVGTPPNLIVTAALKNAGLTPFTFFEFAWIGIPLTVAGIAYMVFFGKRFLPKADLSADQKIEQEIEATVHDTKKMVISGIIMVVVVIIMAFDSKAFPMHVAAVIGAFVCVLTGCLTEKQAYRGIDWVTIFVLAGMMPVADALDKSGAGKMIADLVVGLLGGSPSPLLMMGVLFLLSCALTQFMSNTAATALLAPIGISIAKSLGASPHAVLMAIAVAASCAFATPVGTPPNTLVLGPGNYKFNDYVKAGTPLVLVSFIVSMLVIPVVWPFFPK